MARCLMLDALRYSRKKNFRATVRTWLVLVHLGYAGVQCVLPGSEKKYDSLSSQKHGFSHSQNRLLCGISREALIKY